jgi:hypothetical protein
LCNLGLVFQDKYLTTRPLKEDYQVLWNTIETDKFISSLKRGIVKFQEGYMPLGRVLDEAICSYIAYWGKKIPYSEIRRIIKVLFV